MSKNAQDLIKAFLEPDYDKRLGSYGIKEIKDHPFFKGIDWRNLRFQTAPIIPMQLEDDEEEDYNSNKKKQEEVRMQEVLRRINDGLEIYQKVQDLGVYN